MKQFGIQLYSVREEVKQYGVPAVLDVVKKSGFDCVEFAGFYGYTPEEMKKMLDERGLKGVSAHIRLDQIEENLPYIDAIGIKNVYVPWLSYEDLSENIGLTAEKIKAVKKMLDERGVVFGYHNHNLYRRAGYFLGDGRRTRPRGAYAQVRQGLDRAAHQGNGQAHGYC